MGVSPVVVVYVVREFQPSVFAFPVRVNESFRPSGVREIRFGAVFKQFGIHHTGDVRWQMDFGHGFIFAVRENELPGALDFREFRHDDDDDDDPTRAAFYSPLSNRTVLVSLESPLGVIHHSRLPMMMMTMTMKMMMMKMMMLLGARFNRAETLHKTRKRRIEEPNPFYEQQQPKLFLLIRRR